MQNRKTEDGQARQRRKVWRYVVSVLACLVVFCTTYALILPALTLEKGTQSDDISDRTPLCTLESLGVHTHTADCLDELGNPVCGYADFVLHTHDETCYDGSGNLVCSLPERAAHVHTEDCYGPAGHVHTADCNTAVPGEPVCGLEESEDHTHSDGCYALEETLTCGQEEQAAEPDLLCGLEEWEPHTHTGDCWQDGVLVCGKVELLAHSHTESCFHSEPVREAEPVELTCAGPDYTVAVTYGPEAGLPEGVTLDVQEIVDQDAYDHYYRQTQEVLEAQGDSVPDTLVFARFFDVRFLLDGQEIEPAAPVSVTITYETAVEPGGAGLAIHFAESGPELLDVDAETQDTGETSFTHTQDSFSVVGDLVLVTYADNATDTGPSPLPVDYYVYIDGQWTCVGSTKTGWYGNYSENAGWDDDKRDYVKMDQAASILRKYGFDPSGQALDRQLAYQQKTGNTKIYADTTIGYLLNGTTPIVPLSKNDGHPGYNLYYLPNNTDVFSNIASPEALPTAENSFYTVQVYDALGKLLTSEVVQTGGEFSYTPPEALAEITSWLAVYGDGHTETIEAPAIRIENITAPVAVSPGKTDTVVYHSVTFKVCIDGQWQTVGSLPYYYSGKVNGEGDMERAYITSDMAARFFGDEYGYDAATVPGYRFGYSYNDIYEIYYDQSNFCMDIQGGNIVENTSIQLYGANHSDAQTFRIWDTGERYDDTYNYQYITPVTNSGLHVNILGGGSTNGATIALHSATDGSSRWLVWPEANGTVSFRSRNAPDSACIDLDSGYQANGTKIHIWNNTENRYWRLEQVYRISNQTASEQNNDGTHKIYLTPETNGDIVCYYLPGQKGSLENVSEDAVKTGNSFFSVTVRDDSHKIYSEGDLSNMRQVVREGGEATVTVRNGDGVIWSCVGKYGQPVTVTENQTGGYTTFQIENITQPIEIIATETNPSFTVQYYANIPRPATSGDASVTLIDTDGGVLPKNGETMKMRNLGITGTGEYEKRSNGESTQLYRINTTTELTRLYTEAQFDYEHSPALANVDKLAESEGYLVSEIWVLKAGKESDSTDRADWDVYGADTTFTNVASQAGPQAILITNNMVIRLVYSASTGEYQNTTTFYDYNISSGQNDDGRWRTGITGINSESNYGQSLNGERRWRSYCDVIAFGNTNSGTGMGEYVFAGDRLNGYRNENANYGGCTFGLVSRFNKGQVVYNEYIVAPKLFNEGDAAGKQTYAGSALTFERVGDTYTLSAATLNNSNGQKNTISGLQYFNNPSPHSGLIYDTLYAYGPIWTNNFWPMDEAAGKTDPLFGAYNQPVGYQGFANSNNGSWTNLAGNLPDSDDGLAHNCYFGMNFSISFTMTQDYVGPLEYYFFGDDDMWVFLDGRLICDIGGVHSAFGEYVNLWDYISLGGSTKTHTLDFFYTERGASGSTCWMQFTLPSVTSSTTAQDTGSLKVEKSIGGGAESDYSGHVYEFRVDLLTAENGTPLTGVYSCETETGQGEPDYGNLRSGGTLRLKPGQSVTIKGIPAGTYYKVTELTTAGYHVTVNNAEGCITSGTVANGGIETAAFVNTPYFELPQTGGAGTYLYTISGLLLLLGALLYSILRRRRGQDRETHAPKETKLIKERERKHEKI